MNRSVIGSFSRVVLTGCGQSSPVEPVPVVLTRPSARIHELRRGEPGEPVVVEVDLPLHVRGLEWVGFGEAMVVATQEDPESEAGDASCLPGLGVVPVAGRGRCVAAGEGAAPVADGEGCADGFGEVSPRPSDIEWPTAAPEDHGDQVGVAGEPSRLSCRDAHPGVEDLGFPEAGEQGVVVQGDDHVGSVPAVGGELAAVRRDGAEPGQGVGSLRCRAWALPGVGV